MTETIWLVFGLLTMVLPLVVAIICVIILRFTLDRRVRWHLPSDKIYDCWLDVYFGFGRATVFGYACAWPRINNSPNVRPYYNDMDIKQFANRFEAAVGYVLTYRVATLTASIIIFGFADLFGFYDLG
jgi:hypothetical protein